jgi:hypothetical protein
VFTYKQLITVYKYTYKVKRLSGISDPAIECAKWLPGY